MKQNNYTAKDIERYHSGQLSSAEMHALEKAALDDLFLADALEGYQHTGTATADLTSLQQKLQGRIQKEEGKRKTFFIGNNWMKIAALFILFAGGGWLVFQMFADGNKKSEIAVTPASQQKTPTTSENRGDSIKVYSDAPSTNNIPLNESTPATGKNATKKKEITPSTNNRELVIIESHPQRNVTFPSVSNQSFDSLQTMAMKRFEPSALKKDASADSLLARSAGYEKEKSRAKNSEEFSARLHPFSTDKKISGQVSGVKVDTIKNFDVVLQPAPMAEVEVVVVNQNKTVARQDARRRMHITVDTLEPVEGWTNFGDYIATNMRAPEELETKPVKGEVELSFEVNKQGEPVNITVVRSLCEKCDEEAIRLLKEGPRWKKNKKKGKVKFNF